MITPNDALQFIKDHHNGEIPYTFGKNEYARWMAEFANYTVTKHLHKLGVVRGGDSETFTVQGAEIFISGMEVKVTPFTPTEPLPAAGSAKSVCEVFRCIVFAMDDCECIDKCKLKTESRA